MKTAVAVMLTILLFHFLDRGAPMIAALAAVFSLRQDLTTSVSFGKSRILGNSLGGALSIVYFVVQRFFDNSFLVELLLLPTLVVVVIVLSDGLNNNAGIISAIATMLLISLSIPRGESVYYALDRVIDTFIGTFIAIALNFIRPKPPETKREIDEDMKVLAKKEAELAALKEQIQQKIDHEKASKS
ncbi:membrane protein [Enterococcus canis]|uniref:Membrane protein n=2 Tax=Enterococcus canis TaxID=214095 RepID=A0A1L8RJG2_9ENTE|nr:membrane protein [Enterococcus canis]